MTHRKRREASHRFHGIVWEFPSMWEAVDMTQEIGGNEILKRKLENSCYHYLSGSLGSEGVCVFIYCSYTPQEVICDVKNIASLRGGKVLVDPAETEMLIAEAKKRHRDFVRKSPPGSHMSKWHMQ